MDPVTVITTAVAGMKACNSAFSIIKQTISNGRELASCGKSISTFFAGAAAIEKEINDRSAHSNASSRALEIVAYKNQVAAQRDELRTYMQLYCPSGTWNEFVELERQFRLEAKKAKEAEAKKRRQRLEKFRNIAAAGLIVFGLFMLIGIGLVIYLNVTASQS
jgi:hypothetical protein